MNKFFYISILITMTLFFSKVYGKYEKLIYDFKVETFLYIFSIILSFYLFFNKNKKFFLFSILISIILFFIIFLFSSRPVPQYTIYFFPIIIIYALYVFTNLSNKILSFFFISVILIVGTINANIFIKNNMFKNRMNIVCTQDNISSEYTYMRQWHARIDENFIASICDE